MAFSLSLSVGYALSTLSLIFFQKVFLSGLGCFSSKYILYFSERGPSCVATKNSSRTIDCSIGGSSFKLPSLINCSNFSSDIFKSLFLTTIESAFIISMISSLLACGYCCFNQLILLLIFVLLQFSATCLAKV